MARVTAGAKWVGSFVPPDKYQVTPPVWPLVAGWSVSSCLMYEATRMLFKILNEEGDDVGLIIFKAGALVSMIHLWYSWVSISFCCYMMMH